MPDPYDTLERMEAGDHVSVKIEPFENARSPRDETPQDITGEVVIVDENVSHSAGEILYAVYIGPHRDDGCVVDVGDTRENAMTGGHMNSPPDCYYAKAWRPRPGKDRLLLGRVTKADLYG